MNGQPVTYRPYTLRLSHKGSLKGSNLSIYLFGVEENYKSQKSAGFSPEMFEGVVAFSGVIKLGSITNVTQSAT